MSDPTPPGESGPPPGWGTPEQPPGPYGPPVAQPQPGVPYPQQQPGQPPGQPPWQQPGHGTPYGGTGWHPSGPVTNQKAQWALVAGLVSIPLACCSAVLGLVGIVGVVLGVQARREIAASGGQQSGSGIAMTGIVTGVLATLIGIGLGLLLVLLLAAGEGVVVTG